ncbi:hypothetical protein GGI12_004109 [Dipsacomyces acuminosporus]|nr:hypothetical protein GGI12_004109 [Dipsacomyces acuminosporus]
MKLSLSLATVLAVASHTATAQLPQLPQLPPIIKLDAQGCVTLAILGIVLLDVKAGTCTPAFSPANPMFADQMICNSIYMLNVNPASLNVRCSNSGFVAPGCAVVPTLPAPAPMPTNPGAISSAPSYVDEGLH